MSEESLQERKAAIEKRYADIEAEMRRLEGEHRLILDLLQHPVQEKPKRIRKVVEDAPTE
jgi:predicted metal-dependent hydrolase